jgi:hypothetical protein
MFIAPTLPAIPYLTERCQRFNAVGKHSVRERVSGRVAQGLGIKGGIRRWLSPSPAAPPRDPLGAISRFAEGSWVRVRDEASIRETLDARSCLRGLKFSPGMWMTCSKVYRVSKVMRRIIDDERRMRPVARTVLLSGVDCTANGTDEACGRYCPLMYRDEWLEPSEAPPEEVATHAGDLRLARVRSLEQILGRLDLLGQREGLLFMPEMGRYAGIQAPILQQLPRVLEYGRWVEPRGAIYILDGLHCTGAILGSDGPCDRACRLLWHTDWLDLDA